MFLADSLLSRSAELREAQQECFRLKENNKQLLDNNDEYLKENKQLKLDIYSKQELYNSIYELFKEERAEKKVLYERIQEFAGLKEKEQIEILGSKTLEFKATESKRGRGAVKAALEERAQQLLKKQKENEQSAIENGALAP